MKRTILFTLTIITGFAFSQEAADKKIQAGLGFSTGLNINKSDTKKMETNGVGSAFSIGLNLNYNFSNTIGFFTGLDVDFERNKIKPAGDAASTFYIFNDTKIGQTAAEGDVFQLTERKQKAKYITIPTMLLFRTKYFGDLRYFAKFGLRTSFLLGNKTDDLGHGFDNNNPFTPSAETTNVRMETPADMSAIRSSVGLSIGTEWNFSGSTALAIEIGYYYGFTPIYRSNDGKANLFGDGSETKKSLYYFDNTLTKKYYSNAMQQSQLQLKVAVLF